MDRQVLFSLVVIPLADRQHAGLQLQHGRQALDGLHAVVADILTVGVDVDKTGGNHMAGGIDGLLAGDLVLGDEGDLAILDADVDAPGIKAKKNAAPVVVFFITFTSPGSSWLRINARPVIRRPTACRHCL
jgi:hypothetical protein